MKPTANDKKLKEPEVDREFRLKALEVLANVRAKHPELIVTEVFRSVKRQRQLYCKGRSSAELLAKGLDSAEIRSARRAGMSAAGDTVTGMLWPKYHGAGLAMDCAWLINGAITWNVPRAWWLMYVRAGKAHGLKSLGPSIGDWGHLQLGG